MKTTYKGLLLAAIQCLIALSLAGQYAWDRAHLPKVWALAVPVDPQLPVRGRYVSLRLALDMPELPSNVHSYGVRLSVKDGHLHAEPQVVGADLFAFRRDGGPWTLNSPLAYFIPDKAPDPSRLSTGEKLWVEVSIPANGPPRPLQLRVTRPGEADPTEIPDR